MNVNKTTTGKALEDKACLYLTKNGYNIIERNFRLPFGEIDIVARDRETKELVFGEVKGLTIKNPQITEDGPKPEDHFNYAKVQKFKKIITAYLNKKDASGSKYFDTLWRVDLIAIKAKENGEIISLNHYKNIYIPFD